jgi:hypothetical protein
LDFSENLGDLDDYVHEYEDVRMTAEAKTIYEAILETGPLDTVRLRREVRMSAERTKIRSGRTLVELQVGLIRCYIYRRPIEMRRRTPQQVRRLVHHVLKQGTVFRRERSQRTATRYGVC